MTPGRLLAAIGFAAVVVVLAALALCREADALRLRTASAEASCSAAHLAVEEALFRAEAEGWERQRVEWEMVPARTRREVTAAVLLRPARGTPAVVDLGETE